MTFKPNRIPLLLLSVIVLIRASYAEELRWWQNAVFYQIYPRSYQDSNNDGIGDLKGIIEHIEYLKDLGINGIWMNPINKSPLRDFGYDISNYTSIDKTFGPFEDFIALVEKLHSHGMYILLDLVPNHTSDEHLWFKESKKGNATYKDYYVWADGKINPSTKNITVPNNWASVFSGTVWKWNDNRKQYYYHAFLPSQPDLNYRNPAVVEEMKNIFKFWLDHGVDGFRVDAVHYLTEDAHLRDEPYKSGHDPAKSVGCFDCLEHIYTQNVIDGYDILSQFYDLVANYENPKYPGDKITISEVYAPTKTLQNYFEYNGKKTSTMTFNFQLLNVNKNSTGQDIKNMVDEWTNNLLPGAWSNWVISNHDQSRIAHKVGVRMADGMNMIVLLLSGTSFAYYGDELGMDDTFIDCNLVKDIQAFRRAGTDCRKLECLTRDVSRTPMQWNHSLNAGFSNHQPWLPINFDYLEVNVEALSVDPRSHLNIYKQLIALKQEMGECMNMTTMAPANGAVFGFTRFNCKNKTNKYLVLVNFSSADKTIDLSKAIGADSMFVRSSSEFSSSWPGDCVSLASLKLQAKEGLVLSTTVPSS